MTVNKENIQKVIDLISKDDGTHFRMAGYVMHVDSKEDHQETDAPEKFIECSTAFCLAGYANLLRMEEEGESPKLVTGKTFYEQFASSAAAAEWLGINKMFYESLFLMNGGYQRDSFDSQPAKVRRQAAINVLSHLRDTGEIDWHKAIKNAQNA